MAKKNQRIFTILGIAAGTGLAVYSIRRGMEWYKQWQWVQRHDNQLMERAREAEWHYQAINQPERQPIPATGTFPSAPSMAGMTTAERVNSDRVRDFDDRGTAMSNSEMNSGQVEQLTGEQPPVSESTTEPQVSQDDYITSQGSEIIMDDFAAPLIEHAIAFNSLMNLLRSRQRSGTGYEGAESLTEGDRTSIRSVLDQMQGRMAEYNETAMRNNPLAQRSYKMTLKLRDALDNLDYSGADLFRIYGEVRTELCKLTKELDKSGQVTITGITQIRQLYECDQ